jgi:hypothetical protein
VRVSLAPQPLHYGEARPLPAGGRALVLRDGLQVLEKRRSFCLCRDSNPGPSRRSLLRKGNAVCDDGVCLSRNFEATEVRYLTSLVLHSDKSFCGHVRRACAGLGHSCAAIRLVTLTTAPQTVVETPIQGRRVTVELVKLGR